jgi:hypothetical protein
MCLTYRVRIDERLLAMFDLCPPDIGSMSKDIPRRPIFPKIRISHLGVFRWTKPNGVKMVVGPIAKLSEEAASTNDLVIELRGYDERLPTILGSNLAQTLCCDAVPRRCIQGASKA